MAGTTIARSAHHGGHRLTTRGTIGKAAYLAGERLHGHDGQTVDYRSKANGVEHSQLIPLGGGTADRERLWSAIDAHPTQRPTATIARDMIVAFPHELSSRSARPLRWRWVLGSPSATASLSISACTSRTSMPARTSAIFYRADERYQRLAASTRRGYDQCLGVLENWSARAGHPPVKSLCRKFVRAFYRSMADAPAQANAVMRVLLLALSSCGHGGSGLAKVLFGIGVSGENFGRQRGRARTI